MPSVSVYDLRLGFARRQHHFGYRRHDQDLQRFESTRAAQTHVLLQFSAGAWNERLVPKVERAALSIPLHQRQSVATVSRDGPYPHFLIEFVLFRYPALSGFLEKYQYPLGTVNLRKFAWKLNLLKAPDTFKVDTIAQMICSYPFRRYVCVGDSGELDPESYAQIYQIFPQNIVHIFIRDICATGECLPTCQERYKRVFADVPAHRWTILKDANQIETDIAKLLAD